MRWTSLILTMACLAPCEWARAESPVAPVEPYRVERGIEFARPAGETLALDAYLPTGTGPFPAVLVVHGGAWMSGTRNQLRRYAQELAERGYVALAIDYRLAPWHRFPAQIDDCRAALDWLVKNAARYKVDTDRLGAIGYSAGGHLVALLGTTALDPVSSTPLLKCIVAGGAPCDFRQVEADWQGLTYWLGGPRGVLPKLYDQASPAAFVTADAPPMFFFHGESDSLVPTTSPEAMVAALKKAGVEADLYVLPQGGHVFTARDPEALRRGFEFLDRHLLTTPAKTDAVGGGE